MSTESRQATCEERIEGHLAGRLADFAVMAELAGYYAEQDDELSPAAREMLSEEGMTADECADHEISELGDQRLQEYPLGVSSRTVFRVELSTGGPGDWLEVECSGDTPAYEGGEGAYEVERITYHFNDWFDHAERELHGDELATAQAFAERVVPELIG